MRIESRDFRVPVGGYADPVLFPRADWRDVYRYGASGDLQGWDRAGLDGQGALRFDAAGRVMGSDGAQPVRHIVERPTDAAPHLRLRLRRVSGDSAE